MKPASWIMLGTVAAGMGLYETSFIGSAPAFVSYIRPIIPIVALFIFLHRQTPAYVFLLVSGLVIDLISAVPTGFITARWLVVALLIDLVFEKSITNRSLYGVWMLVVMARIADFVIQFLTVKLLESVFQKQMDMITLSALGYIVFADLIFISVLFVAVSMVSKRFLTSMPMTHGRYEA